MWKERLLDQVRPENCGCEDVDWSDISMEIPSILSKLAKETLLANGTDLTLGFGKGHDLHPVVSGHFPKPLLR